ncbi:MAG: putative bifunctional diguanylate cyclase/phosphodiesterase [Nocardioidaceae bacterium]
MAIALILIMLRLRPRRSIGRSDAVETINLDEVLFVPALIMLVPWQTYAVMAAASVAGSLWTRRGIVKTAFNLGQLLIAATAGILVIRALGVQPSQNPTIWHALVGMLGALVMTLASALIVRGMVSYATDASFTASLKELVGRFAPWLGAVSLGGLGVVSVAAYRLSVILVIAVAVFVHRAYAASVTEVHARRQAERLQRAVVSLRTQTEPDLVRADLLAITQDMLGAGSAEIVPAGSVDPARALSASISTDERLLVDQRRGTPTWDERDKTILLTLASVAGDILRSADLITRLRTITNSQSEGVIAVDRDARITFANPAACHMLGCSQEADVMQVPIQDVFRLRQRRVPIDFKRMVDDRVITQDAEGTLGTPDGDTSDIAYSITPLRAEGTHVGAVLVLRDVTERRAFEDELTRRALHDDLTGLPNRRLLLERLDHALIRSSTTGLDHGLLFLDLDRFKLVNDSYGHLVGDELLVQVSARLRSGLEPANSLARMSGDEFIVLIEDVQDISDVTTVAERLLLVLQEPFAVEGHHIFMSASIGVGLTQLEFRRDEMLAGIDAATYAAKAAGRNCYAVTTDVSVDETRARLDLEISLRNGLDEDELELHYQPIVTAQEGDVVGVEALVRWRSPKRGIMWPQQFVPLAEETGLIVPMGRWVLEEACRTVREWTIDHPDRHPLSVSVNLSALQFTQHRLPDDVASILQLTGLPPEQLCLEITETVLMSDTASTQATLESLHKLGVSVAIDDFGTGYSSLSYLKRFTIDVVKLDRTFVEGLVTDPVDAEIASAVIKLTKALHINTIAEGVETESQRRKLVEMGCPLLQGYITAPALTPPDFLELWQRSHERAASATPPRALRQDGQPTDRAVLPRRRRSDPE